jgi:hypothetical protein
MIKNYEVGRHKLSLFIKLANSLFVLSEYLFTRDVIAYRRGGWRVYFECVFGWLCALA